jgi:hypothetical protein
LTQHCDEMQELIKQYGLVVLTPDGKLTDIYWHLAFCDACAERRFNNRQYFEKKVKADRLARRKSKEALNGNQNPDR